MTHHPNFSAELNYRDAIYEIAKRLGFTQTRGALIGEGSPREMLEAIGRGAAAIIHIADDMWCDLVQPLRALADEVEMSGRGSMLAVILRECAASIEIACNLSNDTIEIPPAPKIRSRRRGRRS